MKVIFRDYKDTDYSSCEALVNDAWAFDENFKPQALSNIAKCMYTKGSVLGSNYKTVVEIDEKVVGFIFGLNEKTTQPKKEMLFGLMTLLRIFLVKGMSFKSKKSLIAAINNHEINRSKLVKRGKSEITLFIVDKKYQGIGHGKTLLSQFITHCKSSNIKSIIVETNKLGASSFYEGVGFTLIGDFESPLHEYATKNGQACMYELKCP